MEAPKTMRPPISNLGRHLPLLSAVKMLMTVVMLLLLQNVTQLRAESCGRKVTYLNANTAMQLLTSPSYPQDYENNEHCQWVLTAMMAGPTVVQIETVDTDLLNWDGDDCEDYLAVYDGLDRTKPLLRKWCGRERPVIKSSGKSVLVVFHTDQHLTGKGFAFKFYSMEQYSSKCDPDRTISLETSLNPLFVDLPSYTGIQDISLEQVQCRYLFTSNQEDVGQVLRLELHSAIRCEDGNFTIRDGPTESSPVILSWCYGTDPFDVITTSQPKALVTFTLLRPDMNWHDVLRVRALARSRPDGCSQSYSPTVQVTSRPTFIAFPYTTSVQGALPCSLRLWAKGRYQTLRLDLVNSTKSDIQCGDLGISFYDGYSQFNGAKVIGQACDQKVVHSTTHNLVVAPGKDFPLDKVVIIRVVALDFPCNNNTERRKANSDRIETLPSLATNTTGYPNDAQCRYLLSAPRPSDSVEVEVQGRMVSRRTVTCDGDYIAFYDGETTFAPEIDRWCGLSRRTKVTSSGRHLLVVVVSDQHDNLFDGFTLEYYAVPGSGRCSRHTEVKVNSTVQRLTSPNYPFYYPINTYCEWLLTAGEGETVVVQVVKSEMEGDCSDIVRVYDGEVKSLEQSLGRWCASERPKYRSTGRHLLLIFQADDRWNTGGFELHYFVHSSDLPSRASVWAIIGGLLAAIIIIIIVVIVVVLYMRHWRREQQKI